MADRTPHDQAWDRFLESRANPGFMQSSWWAVFQEMRGRNHWGATLNDGVEVIGGARVIVQTYMPGHCFYYVPDGPVLPPDEEDAVEVLQAILELVDNKRQQEEGVVSHLRLEPRWSRLPCSFAKFRQARDWMEPRDTLCLNLQLPDSELLMQMKPKGRYNIRVAQKHGVEVVEDGSPQGIRDFLEIYGETYGRHGLHPKREHYFRLLIPLLVTHGLGSIFFAEYQRARLAAALIVHWAHQATYFYGGSRNTERHVMAPYLLHYEVMRNARCRGCRWYDLYGIAPSTKPDHPWAGLSKFKRQFGGQEVNYVRTHDLIFNSEAYEQFHIERYKRRQRNLATE